MRTGKRISLIVPTYNCLALTQAFLETVRTTLAGRDDWELLFIDDGSSDGTRDWLGSIRDASIRFLLNERNLGYAATNNRGAREASGEVLALLNNDLLLSEGWLTPMLRALESPSAGIVGNVQFAVSSGMLDHAGITVDAKGRPTHVRELPPWTPAVTEWPAVTGACCLLSRSVWESVGGFEEAFQNGGEDVDLCFRLAQKGLRSLVATRSQVRHHVSSSPNRKLRDEANSCRLARRWHGRLVREAVSTASLQLTGLGSLSAFAFEDPSEAAHLAGFQLGLVRLAPASAVRAVEDAMRIDEDRWRKLGFWETCS